MSNPESVNKLVKDLTELAKEAENVQGGAYGLTNLSGGVITGGRKGKGKGKGKGKKKVGTHAMKVKAFMKKHKNSTLGQASHAVAQGRK